MWLPNSRERSFAQAAEFPREIVRAYRELPGETFPIPGRDPFQLVLAFLVFHSLEYMCMCVCVYVYFNALCMCVLICIGGLGE